MVNVATELCTCRFHLACRGRRRFGYRSRPPGRARTSRSCKVQKDITPLTMSAMTIVGVMIKI